MENQAESANHLSPRKDFHTLFLIVVSAALLHQAAFISQGKYGGPIWKAGLYSADQMEYAQMARHLARGDGFVTSLIQPCSLARMPVIPHPNFAKPPLYPLAVAVEFAIAGPHDSGPAIVSFICYLFTVGVIYLMARRTMGIGLAMLAALWAATLPLFMLLGGTGLSETLATLLLTLSVGLLADRRHPFLAGCALGLLGLTRSQYLFILFPFCVYLGWQRERRPALVTWCIAGFLVVSLPWWMRNALLTGDPFYSLISLEPVHNTKTYTGSPFYGRTDSISPLGFIVTHPGEMLEKEWSYASQACLAVSRQIGPLGGLLLLLGLVLRRVRPFTILVLSIALLQIGVVGLGHFELRYILPLLPLLILAGIAALGEWQRTKLLLKPGLPILAVIILGQAAWVAFLLSPDLDLKAREIYYRGASWLDSATADSLRKETAPDEVIYTSIPWAVAWQCDRPALGSVERVVDLEKVLNLEGIRVTSVFRGETFPFRNEAEILDSTPFRKRFYLHERLPGGASFYKLKQPGDDWLNRECPWLAWDPLEKRAVTLDYELKDIERWGDAVYRLRSKLGRIRDFALTPDGKGLAVLLDNGSIQVAGDAIHVPTMLKAANAVALALTGQKAGAILHASGIVTVFGGLEHRGHLADARGQACDLNITADGSGWLILNRFGHVDRYGLTPKGKTPQFGWPAAVALEPLHTGKGWYVLDVYGAIHKSDPEMPDLLGPYSPNEKIARDFLIAPDGNAYVLTTDGTIHVAQKKLAGP